MVRPRDGESTRRNIANHDFGEINSHPPLGLLINVDFSFDGATDVGGLLKEFHPFLLKMLSQVSLSAADQGSELNLLLDPRHLRTLLHHPQSVGNQSCSKRALALTHRLDPLTTMMRP